MTMYVDGLSAATSTVVSLTEKRPYESLTSHTLVQFALDEGKSYRARIRQGPPAPTNLPVKPREKSKTRGTRRLNYVDSSFGFTNETPRTTIQKP